MAGEPPGSLLRFPDLPARVVRVLSTIAGAGHEVALVGGSVRDQLAQTAVTTDDWDAATSARPEQTAALFDDAVWENRFGTVTIEGVEVTSYRAEGPYEDRRRPGDVRFGVSLEEDLARRDFTINAIAWVPVDLATGLGRILDPHGGSADMSARLLRAVGEPRRRFDEDALRLIRAARFAGRFEMAIDPATESAIAELAPSVATVSVERVRDEILRILRLDPRPSRAFLHLERLGLLAVILPELVALRGVPQSKAVPGDALDHTLATVDELSPEASRARLAALLHDLGKATTLADGHFIGHDAVGAELAAAVLGRLRVASGDAAAVVGAIRNHMYAYDPEWTDAAVRRFLHRLEGVDRELLFALRRADNRASGAGDAGDANQAALEGRIADELADRPDVPFRRRLAIDGHDLQAELGLEPGPLIGELLDRLVDAIVEDPSRNERAALLDLARELSARR